VCDDGALPALPTVFCGIFVRESAGSEALDQIADQFVQTLRPPAAASDAMVLTPPASERPAAASPSH
jgi:hypothetical protein